MKNAVLWDIKSQFVPHRRHIKSPLQSAAGKCYTIFEVFTAVTMKNVVFWDVMPYSSCKNRRFEEMYHLHHQGDIYIYNVYVLGYKWAIMEMIQLN
jgi:hypothetical protein